MVAPGCSRRSGCVFTAQTVHRRRVQPVLSHAMVRMNDCWIGMLHYVHAPWQRGVAGYSRQQMIGRSCRVDQRLQDVPMGAGVGLGNMNMTGVSATRLHIREVELISAGVELQQPRLFERPGGMCVRDRRTVRTVAEARRRFVRGCVQRELGR